MTLEIKSFEHVELASSWTYKLTVLADIIARRVTATVQSVSGLNLSQWRVIVAVMDGPGRTASQVADVTPMDKGIVSRAVGALVERGLVERGVSNKDGRLSHLHLTEKGKNTYHAIVTELDRLGISGRPGTGPATGAELVPLLDKLIDRYREATAEK